MHGGITGMGNVSMHLCTNGALNPRTKALVLRNLIH